MTTIDRDNLRRRAEGRIRNADSFNARHSGTESDLHMTEHVTVNAREIVALLDALTRLEAQSETRRLQTVHWRQNALDERGGLIDALEQIKVRDAAITDARSHARRIIAHPDRWIAQDLVDATSNMLSALKGAPTIKGGAVQWKQAADEAEARSKALAEDVAHIDALYEQEQSRIKAVEHLLDKTDSMFVGAISAEHRAILISKVRRALDVP